MIDVRQTVLRLLAPIRRKVETMIVRAVIELVDDSTGLQTVQASLQADIARDGIERFQDYGITSVPSKDAEALVLMVGGDSTHPVCIRVEDRTVRITGLEEGEVCLYTKQNGKRILLKKDGKILIGTDPSAAAARADKVLDELNKIKQYLTTMASAFSSPIPEAGMGAPSSLGTALNVAHQAINPTTLQMLQSPDAEEVMIK